MEWSTKEKTMMQKNKFTTPWVVLDIRQEEFKVERVPLTTMQVRVREDDIRNY